MDDGLGTFELTGYLLQRRSSVDHVRDLFPELEAAVVRSAGRGVAERALAGAGRQVAAGQVVGVNAVGMPVGSGP